MNILYSLSFNEFLSLLLTQRKNISNHKLKENWRQHLHRLFILCTGAASIPNFQRHDSFLNLIYHVYLLSFILQQLSDAHVAQDPIIPQPMHIQSTAPLEPKGCKWWAQAHIWRVLWTLGWGCGMWLHQPRAAAGGPSMATRGHLCHPVQRAALGGAQGSAAHWWHSARWHCYWKAASGFLVTLFPCHCRSLRAWDLVTSLDRGVSVWSPRVRDASCPISWWSLWLCPAGETAGQSVFPASSLWGVCTSDVLCWNFS